MPTKRTLLVTALVTLLVAASGCSALTGSSGNGQAIAEQTNEAMQDVDSYTFDLSMSLSSDQSDQTIEMGGSGSVDLAAERLHMTMDVMGQSVEQYIVGDTMYINQGGTWQQQDVPQENLWNQQQLAQQQEILENASVTLQGNTTVDGTDVYELSVDVDEDQLMEILQQQQGQQFPGQVSLNDISYTMYVTHDDHYLKRINADMSMSASGQNADVQLEMTFSDFNGDVSIELPPEAENAQSTTG
jgi:outer membrane lipoprotein-sorting protein